MNTPEITTERLRLRRFQESDAEALFSILSDREVNTFLPWFPLETLAQARTRLREGYLKSYEKPLGFRYAVCLKGEPAPVGYVELGDGAPYDLGYGLKKAFWHQGITTEACRAVLGQVRLTGLPYVTATHDRNNPRSGSVMRALGMRYRYSYEELWQPKNLLVTFRLYQLNLDGDDGRTFMGYWERFPVHFIEDGLQS
ncbi:MAG: GNAT family N-acetyltransferase [Christensenellaceae bacterium]|jgi:RimJ/RimL family protein N-acetyltransferase|nr:GNAT family N-acetyltransferase [Christensenellaceae bacterium]